MAQGKDGGTGGYTLIPDSIGGLPAKELSMIEKVLLCKIISLSKGRPCEMSNAAFASCFGVTSRRITEHVAKLREKGWIDVTGPRTKRFIQPTERALSLWTKPAMDGTSYRRNQLKMEPSSTMDGTVLNYGWNHPPKNIENIEKIDVCANGDLRKQTSRSQSKRKKFVPPSLDEVARYIEENKLAIDPRRFFDFYTAGEWHDSNGKPVQNWKQKALTWDGREQKERKSKPPVSPSSAWGGIPIAGSASDESEEERRARVEAAIREMEMQDQANR